MFSIALPLRRWGFIFQALKKYKKYVITLSQVFPVTHIRKGEPTGFKDKFLAAIGKADGDWLKLHTIRANYELWKKRFEEIEAGRACLCIRQWTGKPYCSKQVELAVLTKEDGIGLQKLTVAGCETIHPMFADGTAVSSKELAYNDGLSSADWNNWFSKYDLTEPLAIIHLTSFRYKWKKK